jgi:hypothetical protein
MIALTLLRLWTPVQSNDSSPPPQVKVMTKSPNHGVRVVRFELIMMPLHRRRTDRGRTMNQPARQAQTQGTNCPDPSRTNVLSTSRDMPIKSNQGFTVCVS